MTSLGWNIDWQSGIRTGPFSTCPNIRAKRKPRGLHKKWGWEVSFKPKSVNLREGEDVTEG